MAAITNDHTLDNLKQRFGGLNLKKSRYINGILPLTTVEKNPFFPFMALVGPREPWLVTV